MEVSTGHTNIQEGRHTQPRKLQTSVTDFYLLQSAGAHSGKSTPVSLRIQQNSY